MSKHLYKQYLRIAAKWPKDANKAPERDFANFLTKEIERQFQPGQLTAADHAVCEKRMAALDQLLNNEVLKKYPHNYNSGVFGMRLEDLQRASTYTAAQEKWLGRDHLITPTIKKAFGDILNEKSVLDVGCGNGHYSFDFLKWGATRVVGIDNSEEMIDICNSQKTQDAENIHFEKSDISEFSLKSKFDVATAFFVLQFVHDKQKLKQAIQNISDHLVSGGVLFGLIPNGVEGVRPPDRMGEKLGAQIQKEPGSPFIDGELVNINFYGNGEVCGSATIALHSRQFYEKCFSESGFGQVEWIAPHFTDHARQLLGDQFCNQFLSPPCDIMFKCVKN
ncbi:unnamed protein product [Caenorhabditis sp. 36 PRJEB53466]|nr:unnamed protein product [Caenorhabditis sp. 36 PRJEB53466]